MKNRQNGENRLSVTCFFFISQNGNHLSLYCDLWLSLPLLDFFVVSALYLAKRNDDFIEMKKRKMLSSTTSIRRKCGKGGGMKHSGMAVKRLTGSAISGERNELSRQSFEALANPFAVERKCTNECHSFIFDAMTCKTPFRIFC